MPHPGHTYGLLNRPPPPGPAPRRLGSAGGLPPSLLAAAEEFNRNYSPLGRQYTAQQAAMSGDPRYAAISAPTSIARRILDNVRYRLPRMVSDFGKGVSREGPRALLDLSRTLGAESVGGPGGWITDIIDSPYAPRAPDTAAGRAGGFGGMLMSEIVGGIGADAAAAVRGVRELSDPEGSRAVGSLELLSAVPGFGMLAMPALRTAKVAARAEAEVARAAQAAARAAEQGMVERVAAKYLPDAPAQGPPTVGQTVQTPGLSPEMPLDEASRMARAVEQGFDPANVRSRAANFDPKNAGKNDLMGMGRTVLEIPSAIVGGVAGASADEENRLRGGLLGTFGGFAAPSLLRSARQLDNAGHLVNPQRLLDPELASITERARGLDPSPSTVRAPRTREGIRGIRTAGTPGSGIASIRELDQADAVRQAQKGAHLVRGTDGQYVGAPRGMDSPGALRALRRRLDNLATEGEVGRDWYDRTEAGNLRIAGPHAARTAMASAEQGLWSAGATPDVNLGFSISGHNAYEAGAPVNVGRWPSTQGRRYIDARDAGGVPDLGPKTGVYGGHLDPFVDSPITGTNDIWHARAFGYTNGDGSLFSRGLSPQEHAFMDAETLLSAERLNASRGTDVWDGRGGQAAIWVRMKGADLAERFGLTLEEGMAEARKSYPEYLDKYMANASYEAIPGVGTGHLPGIQGANFAEREAYTDIVPWTTEAGNDVMFDEVGMYNQPTTPGTGYFRGDINPNRTARPLIARSAKEGVNPRDAAVLSATQALRGVLDAQNASVYHHLRPDAKAGQQTSVSIGLDRAATPDEMRALEGLSSRHFPIDTGAGVTLMAESVAYLSRSELQALAIKMKLPATGTNEALRKRLAVRSRDVLKQVEGEWIPAISDAGVVRDPQGLLYGPPRSTEMPGVTDLGRVGVDSNYQSLLELENAVPGGGVVTDEVLRLIDEADALAPTTSSRLSAPTIRRRAGLLAERDDLLADTYGGVREDIQNFRRIFAEFGLAGLRAAREAGVALPAWVLAFLGANELRGEREGG